MSNELSELKKISKILLLSNAEIITNELSQYATTDERKRIWVLIDGKREIEELIQYSGTKKSALYGFLKTLENAELIEFPHGKPPRKLLDFVPAAWLDLIKIEETMIEDQQVGKEKIDSNSNVSQ